MTGFKLNLFSSNESVLKAEFKGFAEVDHGASLKCVDSSNKSLKHLSGSAEVALVITSYPHW